jgi:hypothetical protein
MIVVEGILECVERRLHAYILCWCRLSFGTTVVRQHRCQDHLMQNLRYLHDTFQAGSQAASGAARDCYNMSCLDHGDFLFGASSYVEAGSLSAFDFRH